MGKTANRERWKAEAQYLYNIWRTETEFRYEQFVGRLKWEHNYAEQQAAYRYHVESKTDEHRQEMKRYDHSVAVETRRYETEVRRSQADIALKRASSMQLDAEQAAEMVKAELDKYDAEMKAAKESADLAVNLAAFSGGVSAKRQLATAAATGAEAMQAIDLKREMQEDIRDAQRRVVQRQSDKAAIVAEYIAPVTPGALILQDWVEPVDWIDPLYIKPHDPTSYAFDAPDTNWGNSGLTIGQDTTDVTEEWIKTHANLTPDELWTHYGISSPGFGEPEEDEPEPTPTNDQTIDTQWEDSK